VIFQRSERWPEDRLSTVEQNWKGRTVVCMATGPSLTADVVRTVRAAAVPVVAVNDAYLMAPWADVCYFADAKWWRWHKDRPEWAGFAGERCTIYAHKHTCPDPQVHALLSSRNGDGLSTDPGAVITGANSGYQALNIATLAGASRVVLVAYDCRDVDGRSHFFGEHPDGTKPPYDAIRMRYREAAEAAKRIGVEVLNATPGSRLDMFEAVDLAESLQPHPPRALVPA